MWDWFTGISHFELSDRGPPSIRVVEQQKNRCAISEDKIAFFKKTAALRAGTLRI